MVSCEFEVVADYIENEQATRCQQENGRWQEVIFSITNCTITVYDRFGFMQRNGRNFTQIAAQTKIASPKGDFV